MITLYQRYVNVVVDVLDADYPARLTLHDATEVEA
jgi:hypothetical protein